ncbi:acyltransferase [Microbispora sp. H10670]|uniref:acyltransferase family protein n=1 Tax=Microbispora sp. H10670 TaxID=2729108 RepID=UPI002872F9E1|nr:acyltransferase [Microbispora sp. H10670]
MSLTMLPPAPARAPAAPGPRDRFIDILRVFGMVLVVVQHWAMPVLSYAGGRLTTGNALAAAPFVTWISQVMPLVFFAGGAANAISFRSAARRAGLPDTRETARERSTRRPTAEKRTAWEWTAREWTARRVRRLAWPVAPLAAVWLPLPHLLTALGVPPQPVEVAARTVGQLLWFLAVYLLAVVATPRLLRVRAGVALPVLAGGAVLTDVVRFSGLEAAGYLNVAFVWLAVHQVGFRYADGGLEWLRGRRAAALAVAGFAMVAALVVAGPYPASMIGMPGAVSNMAPPSACLLALFAGQLGLAMLLRPALNALARRPRAEAVLTALAPRMMTVYLWHMTALVAVAGLATIGFGPATPLPGSAAWWSGAPLWPAALAPVLLGLTALFGRWEEPAGAATGRHVAVAAPLVGGALLTLTVTGFAPGPAPVIASIALVGGLCLVSRRARLAGPVHRSGEPAR